MSSGKEGYVSTEYLKMTELTKEEFPEQYVDEVEAPDEALDPMKFDNTWDNSETVAGEAATPADGASSDQPAETTTSEPAADTAATESAPAG